jgi:hypothetical protein
MDLSPDNAGSSLYRVIQRTASQLLANFDHNSPLISFLLACTLFYFHGQIPISLSHNLLSILIGMVATDPHLDRLLPAVIANSLLSYYEGVTGISTSLASLISFGLACAIQYQLHRPEEDCYPFIMIFLLYVKFFSAGGTALSLLEGFLLLTQFRGGEDFLFDD